MEEQEKRRTEQNKFNLDRLICGTRCSFRHLRCGAGNGDIDRTGDDDRQSQALAMRRQLAQPADGQKRPGPGLIDSRRTGHYSKMGCACLGFIVLVYIHV